MARFDVFRNPGRQAATTPFLLDVQSDLLDGLNTCMVIPLRRLGTLAGVRPPERLAPVFRIGDEEFVLETPMMGAVPRHILAAPVASLREEHHRITAALDFLFQGF